MKPLLLTTLASLLFAAVSFGNDLFTLNYRNIPDSMKPAVAAACAVLDGLIDSDVNIDVSVSGKQAGNAVGAYTQSTLFIHDFDGALKSGVLYPLCLAEKLARKELNGPSDVDMKIVINLQAKWYVGTDGKCPDDRYDLFSVVLHEICHGLGVTTSLLVEQSKTDNDTLGSLWTGTAEFEGQPTVFDAFVWYKDSLPIVAINEGTELYSALVDSLLFDNELFRFMTGGVAPLFSPYPYNQGSSVIHLEQLDVVPSLLNRSIDKGVVLHDLNFIEKWMLYALGWKTIFVEHDKLPDSEDLYDSVPIRCKLVNELPYNESSVRLHYSYDGFKNEKVVQPEVAGKEYTYKIPPFSFEHSVDYFYSLTDTAGRVLKFPVKGYYTYSRGTDTIAPLIEHSPLLTLDLNEKSTLFVADITDNAQVEEAYVEFILPGSSDTLRYMLNKSGDVYSYLLQFDGRFVENASIQYRLLATDNASEKNNTYYPKSGFFNASLIMPRNSFFTDFVETDADYFAFDGFSIRQPDGFASLALHTDHLYRNSGLQGDTLLYTASLKVPIVIQEHDAYMIFDEIAMIEIHQFGAKFGEYGFWDYAIVEGSKDGGETWHAFEFEGYDASKHSLWQDAYVSEIVDSASHKNSFAYADESFYVRDTIDLRANKYFRAGDVVNIRFRMMSDAYSYGWGWAIDNLSIQPNAVSVHDYDTRLEIYPQFCDGRLYVSADKGIASWRIIDVSGRVLLSGQGNIGQIDVSGLTHGMYFYCADTDGGLCSKVFWKK